MCGLSHVELNRREGVSQGILRPENARRIDQSRSIESRLMAAEFVRPFRKHPSIKYDRADAAAILVALPSGLGPI